VTTGHVSDLENNPVVSSWLLSIDASANIERNYLQAIKAFCEFTEKRLINLFRKMKNNNSLKRYTESFVESL
jgi:hypothetical protein